MTERDGLGEILVEAKRSSDAAGDAGHLQGVGQPGAIVVALGRDEHLGLVLQPPERLAVDDAAPVALVGRAQRAGLLRALAPARVGGALRPPGEARLQFVGGQAHFTGLLVVHASPAPSMQSRHMSRLRDPAHYVKRQGWVDPRQRAPVAPARVALLSRPPCRPSCSSSTACAAASRASGTRYGLQLT